MNELQQVLRDAPGRLLLRFDIALDGRNPIWKPVAWKPSTAERWQRFAQTPTVPQAEVYSAVNAAGGQMERECKFLGSEMVYWFERKPHEQGQHESSLN